MFSPQAVRPKQGHTLSYRQNLVNDIVDGTANFRWCYRN